MATLPPNPLTVFKQPTGNLAIPNNPLSAKLSSGGLLPAPAAAAPVAIPAAPLHAPTENANEITKLATHIATTTNLDPAFVQHLQAIQKIDPTFQSRLNAEIHRVTGNIEAKQNSTPLALVGQAVYQAANPIEWGVQAVQGAKQVGHGVEAIAHGRTGAGAEEAGLGALGVAAILPFGHIAELAKVIGPEGDALVKAAQAAHEAKTVDDVTGAIRMANDAHATALQAVQKDARYLSPDGTVSKWGTQQANNINEAHASIIADAHQHLEPEVKSRLAPIKTALNPLHVFGLGHDYAGLGPARTPEEAAAHIEEANGQAVLEGHGPHGEGAKGSVPTFAPGETSPETGDELGAKFREAMNGQRLTDMDEKVGAKAENLQKSAKQLVKEQEAVRSVQRSDRYAQMAAAREAGISGKISPEEAQAAMGGARAGDYLSTTFHGLDHFTPSEIEDVKQTILASPKLNHWEATRALQGIDVARAGKVPILSDQRLFARVFGREKDFVPVGVKDAEAARDWGAKVGDVFNIPRSLMAGADISSPFRQALTFGVTHPILFTKNFKPMLRAIANDPYYKEQIHDAIVNSPTFALMKKGGVKFSEVAHDAKSAAEMEDLYQSNYAQRIPIYGKQVLVRTNRGFVGFLNLARAQQFQYLLEKGAAAGWDVNDEHFLKSIGELANISTGRGSLGALKNHVASLNAFFFAPRLLMSRLNYLGFGGSKFGFIPGSFYASLHPVARQEAWKGLFATAAFGAAILGTAKVAGATVDMNPTSSDFAKIKIGNTRIDVLGGFQQILKLATVLATGEQTNSTTGITSKLGGGFGQSSRWDVFFHFLQGKASPIPALFLETAQGKDFTGRPVSWSSLPTYERTAGQNMTPFVAQDVWNVWHASGVGMAFATLLPELTGFGVQAYKGKIPSSSGKAANPGGFGGTGSFGNSGGFGSSTGFGG